MVKTCKQQTDPTVTFWAQRGPLPVPCIKSMLAAKPYYSTAVCSRAVRSESHHRNYHFPFRPKEIDAVLLSHAHIDHCGNLPNLVKQGFIGPIYCTPATRALAAVMLGDAAKIQQEDAAYLNRKRAKGEPKVERSTTAATFIEPCCACRPFPTTRRLGSATDFKQPS